jgi:glycosyltransferase involved in cell wall biosynthesis
MVTACRDEGFGIPLIEAEAVGTPLVISDIPLFHEVGGDAAVFFDTESSEAFASAVLGMDNPTDWLLWSARVREQAAEFSWDESARRLLDLLTGIVPETSEQQQLRRR